MQVRTSPVGNPRPVSCLANEVLLSPGLLRPRASGSRLFRPGRHRLRVAAEVIAGRGFDRMSESQYGGSADTGCQDAPVAGVGAQHLDVVVFVIAGEVGGEGITDDQRERDPRSVDLCFQLLGPLRDRAGSYRA